MASHSSILVWRIPSTEETGGLQLIRSHRVDMTEVTEHACTELIHFSVQRKLTPHCKATKRQ